MPYITSLFAQIIRMFSTLFFKLKSFFSHYCFYSCNSDREIKKGNCFFAFFIVLSIGYMIYQKFTYGNSQVFKNDIRIESIIKAAFPTNYDVEIKKGDMVGLGDSFYIAYGNKKYVKKLYGSLDINKLEFYRKSKNVNFPIIKIFYLQESSIWEPIFSLIPDFINNYILEWRIKELYTYKPIVIDNTSEKEKEKLIHEYMHNFSGLSVFYISDVKVADIDDDGKHEVICTWISYSGGSGGTKLSTIIEFIDRKLSISSGYPDIMDYETLSYLQGFLKYTGAVNKSKYSQLELQKLLNRFEEHYNIDLSNFELFKNKKTILKDLDTISSTIGKILSPDCCYLYNLENSTFNVNKIGMRHTDIYTTYIKYEDKIVMLEAFYLPDQIPHWGKHEWFLFGFIYRDGRWLLDRNINNNGAIGVWLNWNKKYTLHEIHGTYDEPNNIAGLAWSFVNENWNPFAYRQTNDIFGMGMKTVSPVKKYVDKIYE